jgi:hypothetical protein
VTFTKDFEGVDGVPSTVEFKTTLKFLDASFKLDRGLAELKELYQNISILEFFSFFIYALIFHKSLWFAFLSMAHPVRCFAGFFLSFRVPTMSEIIDKI